MSFSSIEEFYASIEDRLTKPPRGVDGSPGILASDVIDAIKDAGIFLNDWMIELEAKQLKLIRPEDYGAIGDGATNDLSAFEAMLDANSAGIVLFKPGANYQINGTLVISANGAAESSLQILGFGAKISTTNADTVPVLRIDNTKRLNVKGLEVNGTVDFDGMWESHFEFCNLKDLRFGVSNLDVFDEHYWNRFTRSRMRRILIYTGTFGGDYTEFNSITFDSCLIWEGDYAIKVYGTANLQGVYFNQCDISYQSAGKLWVENQINDGSLHFTGCYFDDDKGFPVDTKGINVNVVGVSNVPNSANVQNFVLKEGSRSSSDTLSGVRQGSRMPLSVLNLIKNGDLRFGLSGLKISAGLTATLQAGAGYYGNFLRVTGNTVLSTDFEAIAAPYTGWYNVTTIGRNTGNTTVVTVNVVNDTEVLYNPVQWDSTTEFVVSSCHVYLTQGQLYKLRVYLQNGVSNTVDIAYVALSFGKIGLLGTAAHPDATKDVTIDATDSQINLFPNGDFNSSTLPAELVGYGALIADSTSIVTDAVNDQTGNGKLLRYNPVTSADFPGLGFQLSSRFLGVAKQMKKVTLTMRAKPVSGFVNFVINTGGSDSYYTPVYTTGAWNTLKVTIDVPSNATKVEAKMQMAGAGTVKDVYIDAVSMNLGNLSTPWTPSPLDASGSASVSVTGLTTVESVAALKALTGMVNNQEVVTQGYYTANDGGAATYIYSTSATASDDGGSIIIPASAPASGRWRLKNTGEIRARQFGVKADDSNDDTVQLQRAINYVRNMAWRLRLGEGVIKTTDPLLLGTNNVAGSGGPWGENMTIQGEAPTFNWLSSTPSGTNGTHIKLYGTGKTAVVNIQSGCGRYLRLMDFTVSCATEGGAQAGIYWTQTAHSEHMLHRVHSHRAAACYRVSRGGFANGEFIKFDACSGRGVSNYFLMDSDSGQSFGHSFINCNGAVNDGGSIFKLGGGNLGFSMDIFNFNSSSDVLTSGSTGVTFMELLGVTGTISVRGGRVESASTILKNVQGSQNITGQVTINGMHFDGMWPNDTTRLFVTSTGSNSRNSFLFENCRFTPLTAATYKGVNIQLGDTDNSRYHFRNCDFGDFRSFKVTLCETFKQQVIFEECSRKNLSTGTVMRFSKNYAYNRPAARKIPSRPENLLIQSGFGSTTGGAVAAASPWVHTGTSFFGVLYNNTNHLPSANFYSAESRFRQFSVMVGATVYQDVSAAAFSTGENEYRYTGIFSFHAAVNMRAKISLENSSTGTVYDEITVKGGSGNTNANVITVDLQANDSNVGGVLRLRFTNLDGGNPFYFNCHSQHVYLHDGNSYVETTTAALQNQAWVTA